MSFFKKLFGIKQNEEVSKIPTQDTYQAEQDITMPVQESFQTEEKNERRLPEILNYEVTVDEESNESESELELENMTENQRNYISRFTKDDTPGFDAIVDHLDVAYPGQTSREYGSSLPAVFGGSTLDMLSVYDSNDQTFHRHVIGYGLSNLYFDLDSADEKYSGWGIELTMRILPFENDEDGENKDGSVAKHDPFVAITILKDLAGYIESSERVFEQNHYIDLGEAYFPELNSTIAGFVVVLDEKLGTISTANGKVEFLQLVGVTRNELNWIVNSNEEEPVATLIQKMREDNPLLITDLRRQKEYV